MLVQPLPVMAEARARSLGTGLARSRELGHCHTGGHVGAVGKIAPTALPQKTARPFADGGGDEIKASDDSEELATRLARRMDWGC